MERIIDIKEIFPPSWINDLFIIVLSSCYPFCKISIHVEDRQGILASIINNISDNNTNIMNVEARTSEGSRGHISLMLQITDIEHLNRILTNLKSIDGVIEVERIMNQQR